MVPETQDKDENNKTQDNEGITPVTPIDTVEPTVEPVAAIAPTESLENNSDIPQFTPPSNAPTQPFVSAMPTIPIVTPDQPPKQKKKFVLIAIIAATVLAVSGGGAALAYNVWYQNPNKVVTDALMNVVSAETIQATSHFDIKGDGYTYKIDVSGRNTKDAQSTVDVKMDIEADNISLTLHGEGIYSADGDLYVKVHDAKKLFDSLQEQSNGQIDTLMFKDIIGTIDNNWIKIGKNDLGEVSKETEKTQQCFADITKSLQEDNDFRKKGEQEIRDIYQEHTFITIGKSLGSQTVNGKGSLGYELSGDQKVADEFFTALGTTEFGKRVQNCSKDIKFDEFIPESDDDNDQKVTIKTELWISRFEHEITEFTLDATSDANDNTFSMILNPLFNESEDITIPSDPVTFKELQNDIEKIFLNYYSSLYGYGPSDDLSSQPYINTDTDSSSLFN